MSRRFDAGRAAYLTLNGPIIAFLLMPIPIVSSCQDIPALAESCVSQLLPQLNADLTQIQNVMLPARAITNRAFQNRQLPKV